MNQQLPLADIHTPTAIAMWPLAYGWWLLLALIIVMIIAIVHQWRKRSAERLAQKLALIELANINLNDFSAGQQINAILKRAAMHYFGREQVASLSGDKWQALLLNSLKQKQGNKTIEFDPNWLTFGYSATVEAQQVIEFHQFANLWVKKALPGKNFSPQWLLTEPALNQTQEANQS